MTMPARLSFEHEYIHQGKTFYWTDSRTVNANQTRNWSIVAPANKELHIMFRVDTNNPGTLTLFEGSTFTAGTGDAITILNKRRSSTNAPLTLVRSGATVTADGSVLDRYLVGSGQTALARIGGSVRQETEWNLKEGLVHVLRWTSAAGANVDLVVACEYYEVDPRTYA